MNPDTPQFDELFSSDLEPVRRPFVVAGREGYVDLKPMDYATRLRFGNVGALTENGKVVGYDNEARMRFLVTHTVTDYLLWHRARLQDGTLGDWQQLRPPVGDEHARRAFLEQHLALSERFGDWLTNQALAVNGLLEEQQGN